MILGIFSPIPTSLGEKMPRLLGILCDDNDDDDRDVVGCGDQALTGSRESRDPGIFS